MATSTPGSSIPSAVWSEVLKSPLSHLILPGSGYGNGSCIPPALSQFCMSITEHSSDRVVGASVLPNLKTVLSAIYHYYKLHLPCPSAEEACGGQHALASDLAVEMGRSCFLPAQSLSSCLLPIVFEQLPAQQNAIDRSDQSSAASPSCALKGSPGLRDLGVCLFRCAEVYREAKASSAIFGHNDGEGHDGKDAVANKAEQASSRRSLPQLPADSALSHLPSFLLDFLAEVLIPLATRLGQRIAEEKYGRLLSSLDEKKASLSAVTEQELGTAFDEEIRGIMAQGGAILVPASAAVANVGPAATSSTAAEEGRSSSLMSTQLSGSININHHRLLAAFGSEDGACSDDDDDEAEGGSADDNKTAADDEAAMRGSAVSSAQLHTAEDSSAAGSPSASGLSAGFSGGAGGAGAMPLQPARFEPHTSFFTPSEEEQAQQQRPEENEGRQQEQQAKQPSADKQLANSREDNKQRTPDRIIGRPAPVPLLQPKASPPSALPINAAGALPSGLKITLPQPPPVPPLSPLSVGTSLRGSASSCFASLALPPGAFSSATSSNSKHGNAFVTSSGNASVASASVRGTPGPADRSPISRSVSAASDGYSHGNNNAIPAGGRSPILERVRKQSLDVQKEPPTMPNWMIATIRSLSATANVAATVSAPSTTSAAVVAAALSAKSSGRSLVGNNQGTGSSLSGRTTPQLLRSPQAMLPLPSSMNQGPNSYVTIVVNKGNANHNQAGQPRELSYRPLSFSPARNGASFDVPASSSSSSSSPAVTARAPDGDTTFPLLNLFRPTSRQASSSSTMTATGREEEVMVEEEGDDDDDDDDSNSECGDGGGGAGSCSERDSNTVVSPLQQQLALHLLLSHRSGSRRLQGQRLSASSISLGSSSSFGGWAAGGSTSSRGAGAGRGVGGSPFASKSAHSSCSASPLSMLRVTGGGNSPAGVLTIPSRDATPNGAMDSGASSINWGRANSISSTGTGAGGSLSERRFRTLSACSASVTTTSVPPQATGKEARSLSLCSPPGNGPVPMLRSVSSPGGPASTSPASFTARGTGRSLGQYWAEGSGPDRLGLSKLRPLLELANSTGILSPQPSGSPPASTRQLKGRTRAGSESNLLLHMRPPMAGTLTPPGLPAVARCTSTGSSPLAQAVLSRSYRFPAGRTVSECGSESFVGDASSGGDGEEKRARSGSLLGTAPPPRVQRTPQQPQQQGLSEALPTPTATTSTIVPPFSSGAMSSLLFEVPAAITTAVPPSGTMALCTPTMVAARRSSLLGPTSSSSSGRSGSVSASSSARSSPALLRVRRQEQESHGLAPLQPQIQPLLHLSPLAANCATSLPPSNAGGASAAPDFLLDRPPVSPMLLLQAPALASQLELHVTTARTSARKNSTDRCWGTPERSKVAQDAASAGQTSYQLPVSSLMLPFAAFAALARKRMAKKGDAAVTDGLLWALFSRFAAPAVTAGAWSSPPSKAIQVHDDGLSSGLGIGKDGIKQALGLLSGLTAE